MRDLIVAGAGGGGAVVAKELAPRGLDVLLSNDSVEAIDAGLQAQGGMKANWPEFARALWLDSDNDAPPSVLTSDGYDLGLSDVLAGVARSYSVRGPNAHEPVGLDLAGRPRDRKVLLKSAAQFGAGYVVEPRSCFYEHLKFVDDQVSVVTVSNIGCWKWQGEAMRQTLVGVHRDARVRAVPALETS